MLSFVYIQEGGENELDLLPIGNHPRRLENALDQSRASFLTAAAAHIPEELLKQLKIGGRMVVPIGEEGYQEMTLIVKKGEDEYEKFNHGGFVFVPMVSGTINGK